MYKNAYCYTLKLKSYSNLEKTQCFSIEGDVICGNLIEYLEVIISYNPLLNFVYLCV